MIDLGIYKLGVEVGSDDMTFVPSFVKIGLVVQKLKRTDGRGHTHTHTHTQHCDLGIVLWFFFLENGKSYLSIGHILASSQYKSLHVSDRPYFPSAKLRGYMSRGVFYILTI